MARVEEVVRVTNNNELAVAAARCASAALFKLLHGMPIAQALEEALPFAGNTLQPLLEEALAMPKLDSVAAAERFGLPVMSRKACRWFFILHNMRRTTVPRSSPTSGQAETTAAAQSCSARWLRRMQRGGIVPDFPSRYPGWQGIESYRCSRRMRCALTLLSKSLWNEREYK